MDILIIEDERKASRELTLLIEQVRPEAEVIGVLESVEEGRNWLSTHQAPDLIFSDVQLSDGLCFEIFKAVDYRNPIIFCTAYSDFMMEAFSANGIYYILKPVTIEMVEESLKKYERLKQSFKESDYIKKLEKILKQVKPSYQASLLVSHRDKIIPVKTDEIAFFHYDNGVISAHTSTHAYHMTEVFDDLESRLNPTHFFRANRQFIINRKFVTEIERYFSRKLVVKMSIKTPELVVISKTKSPSFLAWLEAAD